MNNFLTTSLAVLLTMCASTVQSKQDVVIGIGTQNTTTNTVTGGVVIKELKLLEKYLPKTGKYKDVTFKLDWQNFTSGPPITNGMMAKKLQIGMMGDYPLLVNGATGQAQTGNETLLVAIIAYNAFGSGNGVVVHKDSPYYELAYLKGKSISVPFGSAAHGMVLQAMQSRGWGENFWSLSSQSPEVGTTNLPTPFEVFEKLIEASRSNKFITNVGMSLRRIAIGFAVATLLGVGLGLLIGRYKRMRQILFPAIEAFRAIPAIAWVPISIMLWPDNEVSIVFITFVGAFFSILLNTVSGVRSVESVLLRAGQCLGAGEPQIMWHIVLPGAAPQIFTGLAIGMGVAWVSLIAAEMISGQFGIGYFTWEAYSLIAYAEIVLGMITIGVLGFACSWAIRCLSKLMLPWLEFTKVGDRT